MPSGQLFFFDWHLFPSCSIFFPSKHLITVWVFLTQRFLLPTVLLLLKVTFSPLKTWQFSPYVARQSLAGTPCLISFAGFPAFSFFAVFYLDARSSFPPFKISLPFFPSDLFLRSLPFSGSIHPSTRL